MSTGTTLLLTVFVIQIGFGQPMWPADSSDAHASGSPAVFSLGAGIGGPSGMFLIAGLTGRDFVVRISGGAWERNWNGYQVDLSYNFTHETFATLGFSVIAGSFVTNPLLPDGQQQVTERILKQNYLGVAYDLDISGFFLQLGTMIGHGDFPRAQFGFQCAYLVELFK